MMGCATSHAAIEKTHFGQDGESWPLALSTDNAFSLGLAKLADSQPRFTDATRMQI